MDDADLPGFYAGLGLTGVVDIHVHFMPDRVLRKVWAYFDALGGAWPIRYRFDEAERVSVLRSLGVRRFPSLLYPHRPAMAAWLNEWARDFAARTEGCVSSATFYPEPEAAGYTEQALAGGARVFKVHLEVGAYDPRDPLLDPVWGQLAEAGVPVVCHCGNGPLPGAFTGPGPIGEVLRRHPRLTLVVAHAGSPEYGEFLDLAEAYPRVHLDTTMAFTDFTERISPFPRERLPQLRDLADRIVLGSDYPNIPYPYAHQVESLARLDLGDDWLRAVLHTNGSRLFGPP
jgi:predicted TIM-barrel fold metal-dependent hydrolase